MEHILSELVQNDSQMADVVLHEVRKLEEDRDSAIITPPKAKPLEFRYAIFPGSHVPDTKSASSTCVTNIPAITIDKSDDSTSQRIALTTDPEVEKICNNRDQLLLDDEGRVRHCGNSSGLYLLQGSRKYQNDLFKIRPRVTATINRVDINPDPTALPSPNLFAYLVDVYFSKINPVFPLLHKGEFMERLNRSEQEMPYFLVNAMFSLSAALVSSESMLNKENLDAEGFFKKARTLLDQAYNASSIENAQGLALMSIYYHISQGGVKSWMYSGMAIRMAEDLGLHRDPDIWNIKLTTAEKETRKRTWWVCYLIDRFSSVCVGRPVSIDDQQFDTPLPSLTDDDLLTPNGVSPRTGLSLRPFHEVIKLHKLIGRILSTMYIVRAPLTSNSPKFRTSLMDLDSQLDVWLNSLPADLAYVPTNYGTGNPPKSPTLIYAHVWYHCALILLHRPFVLRTESSSTCQSSSALICIDAANSLTSIVTSCVSCPRASEIVLFLLFPIFTASTILLLQAKSSDQWIANSSRASLFKNLETLKQIRERCGYAGRYYTILHDLIAESNITPKQEAGSESSTIASLSGMEQPACLQF
ncbi:hypothetical protein K493DRAFT_295310 [Basidiobolus meristosporus CBS 931.73]|uniref:Xylanolytic transcriptional activator regulatory domain-containing protein n=1 Tax=Basidiobolus meristosporus CBS 931.73 TaxID=1314790 RepID=A0A1Y1ZCH3_9FUNG|nr:hypothetical protein K493DRAFT_295310 [Basidiobolus meristosporus CBS 931.73]|eukprot:ORY07864.1 hypothetical protein K493DRAFT_295310 [Basidiobolus meristosporus CBS 931.73]